MSAPDARDVIAATINDEGWTCEAHEPDPFGECQQCHATQLRTAQVALDALTEAGFAVVKLPEQTGVSWDGKPEWSVETARAYVDNYGVSWVGHFAPAMVRPFAAALLAAAAHAEAGEDRG